MLHIKIRQASLPAIMELSKLEPTPLYIDELVLVSIMQSLRNYNGNRTKAAKQLGMHVRTMRNWINRAKLLGIVI